MGACLAARCRGSGAGTQGKRPSLCRVYNIHSNSAALGTDDTRHYVTWRKSPKSGAGIGRLGGISMRGRGVYFRGRTPRRSERAGGRLRTLAMSSSTANRTLFSTNLSERLLRSSHHVAGAFASENKSCTACRAGRSPDVAV